MARELMRTYRLLADHAQFLVFDAGRDPYEPLPQITDETARRGWVRTDHTIYYFTVGQLWDVRLDVIRSSEPPKLDAAERVLSHTLHLQSGKLAVGNPIAAANVVTIELPRGTYSLFLRAFNLGAETETHLADDEFLTRSDLERYELFIVDGGAAAEGVILGKGTLW